MKNNKKTIHNLFKNKNIRYFFGIFNIIFSILLLLSLSSYFFTGKNDQNLINTSIENLKELEESYKIQNWMGKLGAVISEKLFFDWFGLSSLIFIPFFFVFGIRFIFQVYIINPVKNYKYFIITLLWVPVFLAFIFDKTDFVFLAGGIGIITFQYLSLLIGKLGTFILLISIITIFISSLLKINLLKLIIEKLNKKLNLDELENNTQIKNPLHKNETSPTESYQKNEIETENNLEIKTTYPPKANQPIETFDYSEQPTEEKEIALEIEEGTKEKELSNKELTRKTKDFGEYNPTSDLSNFKLPGIDLLKTYENTTHKIDEKFLTESKNNIENTFKNFNISIKKITATIGPNVVLYQFVPDDGIRISKIKGLEDDIALKLSALGVRIIAPIPGKGTIGVEVPKKNPEIVPMKSLLSSEKFQNSKFELPIAFGKTISNDIYITDLAKMPHLLMAGATGQGKSVGLNVILTSLLYKKHPSQIKFVLIDPKKVELTLFNKIERHYLAKLADEENSIITDTKKVINTLNSLSIEMDNRYELLKDASVKNIKEYNHKFIQRKLNPEKGHRFIPYIIVVIDEFADLIMTAGKEVETPIARLAQLARAIGIHLIVATQRPSVNVITGIIKANFPARIAFRVTSKVDSRTILDTSGADQLIGRGDLLISLGGGDLTRLQCAFIDTHEVEKIVDYIGNQKAYPECYLLPKFEDVSQDNDSQFNSKDRDSLFEEAARIFIQNKQGSTSHLQRKLKLGFNRAGRIVDQLETAGIIGPAEGSKPRKVLIKDEVELEYILNSK